MDEDGPDDEPELVGTTANEIDLSTEEAAVRLRPNAPGGTDDPSDGYVERGSP